MGSTVPAGQHTRRAGNLLHTLRAPCQENAAAWHTAERFLRAKLVRSLRLRRSAEELLAQLAAAGISAADFKGSDLPTIYIRGPTSAHERHRLARSTQPPGGYSGRFAAAWLRPGSHAADAIRRQRVWGGNLAAPVGC